MRPGFLLPILPQARRQRRDRLQMESQIWRQERQRGEAAEGPRGRERAPEADAMLDTAALKDPLAKMLARGAKRQTIAHLVEGHGMSARRACRVIGCCRETVRYGVVRQDDPVLRARLKELAKVRRRFGYRRLHVVLRRAGLDPDHKHLFRICRGEQEPGWAQARPGHTAPDGAAADTEPALVIGFCGGPTDGWPSVPDHDCGRWLPPGMPRPDRRHLVVGGARELAALFDARGKSGQR